MDSKVRNLFLGDQPKIFSTCTNTIREHQSWSYKRTAHRELPPGDDKFEDRENHTCDVIKDVVAMNLKHARAGVTMEFD